MTKYEETIMLVESVGISTVQGNRLILSDIAKSLAIIADGVDYFAGVIVMGDKDEHKSIPV